MKRDKVHHKFDPIGINRTNNANTLEDNKDTLLSSFEKSAENVLASAINDGIGNSGMEIEMIDGNDKVISESSKDNTIKNLIEQVYILEYIFII